MFNILKRQVEEKEKISVEKKTVRELDTKVRYYSNISQANDLIDLEKQIKSELERFV